MTILLTEAEHLAICNTFIQTGRQWGIIPILEMETEGIKPAVASTAKEVGSRSG